VQLVKTVKGQSMPAYDTRAAFGIGVTYATSPMGADHTAGYAIAANILNVGGKVDPLSPQGQVELSRTLQVATAALDATGLCLFVAFAVLDNPEAVTAMFDMLGGFYGRRYTAEDFQTLGRHTLARERRFNTAAGFSPAHDRLPHYFKTERLAPLGTTFGVPDEELDKVFDSVA
jgi:aldehyde:ferredoxin oxidoreductase